MGQVVRMVTKRLGESDDAFRRRRTLISKKRRELKREHLARSEVVVNLFSLSGQTLEPNALLSSSAKTSSFFQPVTQPHETNAKQKKPFFFLIK